MNIRVIREQLGMTQAEFAAALGYSTRAVSAWEQGWRPVLPRVERAALALLLCRRKKVPRPLDSTGKGA